MKYYAKINDEYINILNLLNNPFRLRNSKYDRDAICYTEDEVKILKHVYPEIQLEIFKLYKRESNATRNKRTNQQS
jgi:hypothetical protein